MKSFNIHFTTVFVKANTALGSIVGFANVSQRFRLLRMSRTLLLISAIVYIDFIIS